MEKLTNELNRAVAKVAETKAALDKAEQTRVAAAVDHDQALKTASEAYNAVKAFVKELVPSVATTPRTL